MLLLLLGVISFLSWNLYITKLVKHNQEVFSVMRNNMKGYEVTVLRY